MVLGSRVGAEWCRPLGAEAGGWHTRLIDTQGENAIRGDVPVAYGRMGLVRGMFRIQWESRLVPNRPFRDLGPVWQPFSKAERKVYEGWVVTKSDCAM